MCDLGTYQLWRIPYNPNFFTRSTLQLNIGWRNGKEWKEVSVVVHGYLSFIANGGNDVLPQIFHNSVSITLAPSATELSN